MYLMESPLEALVFHYSAAVASSAWAWLAVLCAAALSFWRIRAVGSRPKPNPQSEPLLKVPATVPKPQNSVILLETRTSARSHPMEDGECSTTKGRFTTYFHAEDDGDVAEEGNCDSISDEEEWSLWKREDWRGDLGCRRYLDLTVFDGNVVRLWDRNERLPRRV